MLFRMKAGAIICGIARYDVCAPPRFSTLRLSDLLLTVILTFLAMLSLCSARRHRGVMLCSEVQNRCFNREGCKLAIENYFLHCMDLTDGRDFQCTEQCKNALIMLLSSDEHDGPNTFRDCDCEGAEFCLEQKSRMALCEDDVSRWLRAIEEPETQISCSLATLVCSANTPCLVAIEYYQSHCRRLQDITNPRCSSRCNNSLNILYRQHKAQKLRTCYCDGSENYNCTALKDNTQVLCFGPHIRHPHDHDHARPPATSHSPQEVDLLDSNSVDEVPIETVVKDALPQGSSSCNSGAVSTHPTATLWLPYKLSSHTVLTTLTLILFVLLQR